MVYSKVMFWYQNKNYPVLLLFKALKGLKQYKLPVIKWMNYEDIIHNMATTVSSIVLHIWKMLMVDF